MNTPRWQAWLVAIAIFVLGAAVGVAGATMIGVRVFRHAIQSPETTPNLAERATDRIGDEIVKKLQLTPEEASRVRSELARTAVTIRLVRVRAAGAVQTEMRASIDRIAEGLPEEKRVELYHILGKRYEHLGLPPPRREKTR